MENKIYVGNLPFSVDDNELKGVFEKFGNITEAVIIVDKFRNRSKGFGFVTFETEEAVEKAVSEMNGKEVSGREIKVSKARPREE